jgi:hypothetical protein
MVLKTCAEVAKVLQSTKDVAESILSANSVIMAMAQTWLTKSLLRVLPMAIT